VSSSEMLKLSSGKKVAFFTPSGPNEDWLMKRDGDSTLQDAPKIPATGNNIQDWLQPKAVLTLSATGSTVTSLPQHSIENWLAKCQPQGAAMETEETAASESKEKKTTEIQSWLMESCKTTETPSLPSDSLFNYYRVVKMSATSQWLKKSGSTKEELSTNLIGETYSKIAASGPDEWLLKRGFPATTSSKLSRSISTKSCSECSCGMASMCSDSEVQEKSMEFGDTSSELSDWLAVRKEDVETNSCITSSSDHVSCEVPDNDRWLLKQYCESSCPTNDFTGIKRYKENLAAQSNQQWLRRQSSNMPDNKEAYEETESGMKSYLASLPVDNNQWLLTRPSDSGICKWLARSSSEKCKDCPRMCSKGLFKVFDEVASSNDGWLMSQELY